MMMSSLHCQSLPGSSLRQPNDLQTCTNVLADFHVHVLLGDYPTMFVSLFRTSHVPSHIVPLFHLGIFPLLTGVSIFCLANNHSPVFRNIFGGASNNEGMGLLSWSFDWNLIGSACLYNPIWLQINQDIGIIFTYILMSAVYYGNLWNAKSFPFMSQAIFVSFLFLTNS